jgi:hypothetical protein
LSTRFAQNSDNLLSFARALGSYPGTLRHETLSESVPCRRERMQCALINASLANDVNLTRLG